MRPIRTPGSSSPVFLGVRPRSGLARIGDDAILQVVAFLSILLLGLVQRVRGKHGLQTLGALPGLAWVRLVDDHGEFLALERTHLIGDYRKFLERRDDEC